MTNSDRELLLIIPPQIGLLRGFPAGVISLANYIELQMPGIEVNVLDLSHCSYTDSQRKINELKKNITSKTLFAGITTLTASYQSALDIARLIKAEFADNVVIFGGHHASNDPENVLRSHSELVDLIIMGEGERSLYEVLKHYPNTDSLSGVAYIDQGSFIIRNPSKGLSQKELDGISITFRNQGFIGTPGKFDHVTYVSARGCPRNCSFCAVGNEKIRAKSVNAVVRDFEKLISMGYTSIALEDNFFAHSFARTELLCTALSELKKKSHKKFSWDCQTRVESLSKKGIIPILEDAGCDAVYIGVESFHYEYLQYLNKTKKPGYYFDLLLDNVVPSLLNSKIDCYLNLQFGLPGENQSHERKTINTLSHIGKMALSKGKTVTIFPQLHVMYPGTELFRQALMKKQISADVFELFTKWELDQGQVLLWLGEHFAHGAGGLPHGILKSEKLQAGEFEIDVDAIFRISATLKKIDRIPGIKTFDFGNYIVGEGAI